MPSALASTMLVKLTHFCLTNFISYIVSIFEGIVHAGVHVVVVEGHEEGVDDDAQGDEEIDERIENDERQILEKKTLKFSFEQNGFKYFHKK